MHINVYVDLFDIVNGLKDSMVGDKHYIRRVDSMKALEEHVTKTLKARFPQSSVQLLSTCFNATRKEDEFFESPMDDVDVHIFFTSQDTDSISKEDVMGMLGEAKKIAKDAVKDKASWLIVAEMPSEEHICGVCGIDINVISGDYLIRNFDYLYSPKEEEEEGYEEEAPTLTKEIALFFHPACIRNLGKRESYQTPSDFYGE